MEMQHLELTSFDLVHYAPTWPHSQRHKIVDSMRNAHDAAGHLTLENQRWLSALSNVRAGKSNQHCRQWDLQHARS